MSGDLGKAREILPSLERHDDESVLLANRIEAMLGRADGGGLLLHLSPFGFEDDRPIAELANEIVSDKNEPEEAVAADSLAALTAAASAMFEKGDPSPTRPRMWQGGPVKSSRFV